MNQPLLKKSEQTTTVETFRLINNNEQRMDFPFEAKGIIDKLISRNDVNEIVFHDQSIGFAGIKMNSKFRQLKNK
ncbi:hypothetical protein T01_5147 [Trichinella spiralis]|uniref:Uncharacterized protein n=1 Tax=Trichinella spiralis TaxID=6334 RepID=A0A0V1AU09_TRISP|nr:hypothetical protein T01_5147 [Trichinella spiralis]